ncbi:MAG: DNRLRE domain-containing protein [Deltaproteobacteria bacterium]|nr:DNRLRE domain-containing protein [Deltaproteobacteria bacterium]
MTETDSGPSPDIGVGDGGTSDAELPPDCVEDMCGVCDDDPSNDCVQDCAGDWGGAAVEDECGTCDDDPSNDCLQDCAGDWGGTATADMCGVCDDDDTNDCVQDCADEWGGSATEDMCGTCDADPSNDCDCASTPGGSATTDMCGTCDTDPTNDCTQDCAGTWGGSATLDGCGTCDTDPTNDCPNDCNGVPGGPAALDMCGTCDEDPSNDCAQDCAGAWGGPASLDMCGTCDDDSTNDCVQDCAGDWGGSAVEDMCGTCDDDPANDCVQDCEGTWGGSAVVDLCGRCTGGTTGVTACPTITLTPVADASVNENAPTTNNGTAEAFSVVADSRSNTERAFLRFDLAAVPADVVIRGVSLEAQAFSGYAFGGNGNVYTQFVEDDSWGETTVNWNNQPTTDGVNIGSWWLWYNHVDRDQLGSTGQEALLDVVAREADGDALLSLRLHSPGYNTDYRSREYTDESQRPRLVVGYLPITTVTLEPVADATVSGSSNQGTAQDLRVDRTSSEVYLRFDLSGLPAGAEVVGSTLTMLAYSGYAFGGDGHVYTHLVTDDSWGETTIIQSNAPASETEWLGRWWLWYNGTPSDKVGTFTTDELTAAVEAERAGDGAISFRLRSPGYRTYYRSREYATADQRPQLTVQYVMP